jgi:hypothetical protein
MIYELMATERMRLTGLLAQLRTDLHMYGIVRDLKNKIPLVEEDYTYYNIRETSPGIIELDAIKATETRQIEIGEMGRSILANCLKEEIKILHGKNGISDLEINLIEKLGVTYEQLCEELLEKEEEKEENTQNQEEQKNEDIIETTGEVVI